MNLFARINNRHQKPTIRFVLLSLALCLCFAIGCKKTNNGQPATKIAASNTYLEAAVKDLLGANTPVVVLSPPGTCPGHFDMRRSQMDQLRTASLLLRFDFQATLDNKLKQLADNGLSIVAIDANGGMCVPTTYTKTCKQIADALVQCQLLTQADAQARLAAIEQRIASQVEWAKSQAGDQGFSKLTAVTSIHQQQFAEFLDLTVTNTFSGVDVIRGKEINDIVSEGQNAAIVIANEPEGDKLAKKIASHLNTKLVVLANFPNYQRHNCTFDGLFRENVEALVKALKP